MARPGRLNARAGDREGVVSGVAADCLAGEEFPGGVLVVDDQGARVEALFDSLGTAWTPWRRRAWDGRDATAWPPAGSYQDATVRLPRDWATFAMQVQLVSARLREEGRLFVYGANDEGIRSAVSRLEGLFSRVRTRLTKHRTRVLEACSPRPGTVWRASPDQWKETLRVEVPLGSSETEFVELVSWPGVFASGRLDEGSACLLEVLDSVDMGGKILDFGCGHGVISLVARHRAPDSELHLLDVDAVALAAAGENLPGARLILSDGWRAMEPGTAFDLVLSNPPIHRGKDEDYRACEELLRQAKHHLRPRGVLVTVTQRTVGIGKLYHRSFRRAELLLETPRFQVWRGRV